MKLKIIDVNTRYICTFIAHLYWIIAYNFIIMTKNNIWPMNLNGLRESKVKFKIAIERTVGNYVPI